MKYFINVYKKKYSNFNTNYGNIVTKKVNKYIIELFKILT